MVRSLCAFSALFLLASTSLAQDTDAAAAKAKTEAAAKDKVEIATDGIKELRAAAGKTRGWDLGLKLGGSGSALQNNKFVGQTDGLTLQFGILVSGNADLMAGDHEWRNTLTLDHAQLKTPAIERFIKSADGLELKSLYLYRIPDLPWIGPFARARAFTQVFPGEIVRAGAVTVRQLNNDGTITTRNIAAQAPIALTGPFEPLVLEESAGAFVEPITEKHLTANIRLGAGAQQVITQGGFAAADDAATPELEIVQLANVISAGAEGEITLKGIVVDELLSWNASAGAYYPVLINDNRGLEGGDLLHFNVNGGVSLKLSKWLSIDYQLRLVKQPFVLNELQVQNAILITTGFDLLRSTKKKDEK